MGKTATKFAPLAALLALNGCAGPDDYHLLLHANDEQLEAASCEKLERSAVAMERELADRAYSNPGEMYLEMAGDLALALTDPWLIAGPAAPNTPILEGDLKRVRRERAQRCGDGQ